MRRRNNACASPQTSLIDLAHGLADGMVISAANEVDIKEEPCGVASASTYTITMRRTYAHQPFAHSGLNQIVAHTDCHLD